ncbi:MAG: hypothetical protein RDA78_02475 [Roseibium sp.]|uniref:hypothetical protein n=1 Tax=Roseibium sp. TaxID=1936156 RepID=UPI003D9C0E02
MYHIIVKTRPSERNDLLFLSFVSGELTGFKQACKMTETSILKVIGLIFLGVGLSAPAMAADPPANLPFEQSHGWKFSADVYAWLPQIDMETAAGDEMTLPLWQILQNLNFTAMGGISAQNGRFGGFSDFLYMNLQGTRNSTGNLIGRPVETGVGIAMQAFVNTTAVSYSFVQNEHSEIKAFAGARYLWLESDFSFNIGGVGSEVLGQGHVIDGIVGLRGQTDIAKNYFITYYADVGTGQSDITWQALAGVGYRFKKFDAILGYRYLGWDFDSKANLDSLDIHGPMIGIKVNF